MQTKTIVQVGMIAAIYAALTLVFQPISYGPVQVRIAEALTVLPFFMPTAVPGLFIGCLIANIYGNFGLVDIVLGSLATLAAAAITRKMPKLWLAPLPPVICNAIVVGGYLSVLVKMPLWSTVAYVGLGELIACYGLGYPLLLALRKRFGK